MLFEPEASAVHRQVQDEGHVDAVEREAASMPSDQVFGCACVNKYPLRILDVMRVEIAIVGVIMNESALHGALRNRP